MTDSTPPRPPASLRGPPPRPSLRSRVQETKPQPIDRPPTQEELQGMLQVIEGNNVPVTSVINVLQDYRRYAVPRESMPFAPETLTAFYPNPAANISRGDLTLVRNMLKGQQRGGFRRKSQTARFNRCVKGVRKTVTPRAKSTKESAAIAICTKTILQRKGRTLKKYRKGKRLMTQRLKRMSGLYTQN